MKETNRCDLCGAPLDRRGSTDYCSERCLTWAFFGVPVLKEGELIQEIRENQRRETLPNDWERPRPYPRFGEVYQQRLAAALAELKSVCN